MHLAGHASGEALSNFREAIEAYLESLEQYGEPVPPQVDEVEVEVFV
jgi:predicted RNase H-like HicB family nuclease